MGSTLSVIKTLIVPAIISLIIFLVSTYVLVPLWQRYRGRYSHYIPLEGISTQTSGLRVRVQDAIARWIVPSTWQSRLHDRFNIGRAENASDAGYDSDEGEELEDVDDDARAQIGSIDARRFGVDDTRRLSRDLEEGFRDDSDEGSDTEVSRR